MPASNRKRGIPLGIYVHIPFCRSKCEYCDFYSLGGGRNRAVMERYLQAILIHIREAARQAPGYLADSVYFGGGTPSFFGADGLIRIFTELGKQFVVSEDREVTLEANPDSVTLPGLAKLRRAGFNRISLGVQTDQDTMLKALGRPHTYEQAAHAVSDARRAGFENLSIDLMYGLPNQNKNQWEKTLLHVLTELKPDHISCYGLKVEPGTKLWEYQDCANLPNDDAQADMYQSAVLLLAECGYRQYEISNFAKEGFGCHHNLRYWMGGEYLGFGPAASSDFAGKRFTAAADLEQYITGVTEGGVILSECEQIPSRERAGEYLMLRLRTTEGILETEYEKCYLLSFKPIDKLMQQYKKRGLAEQAANGRWSLTVKGFLVSNTLILELLEAQEKSQMLTKKR